jgi:hypothetical protein
MQKGIYLLIFCFLVLTSNAQNNTLKITASLPKVLKAGQSYVLKVKVSHNYTNEKTGGLTCSLINSKTHTSVDGWFLNIFPFQYFTTIANTPFETEFPFTVAHEYKEGLDIELVATVDNVKDSLHLHAPILKIKP